MDRHQFKFKGKTVTVDLYDKLGQGSDRVTFDCDYVDEDGRYYVVKRARHSDGRVANRMEYYIAKYIKGTEHGQYIPLYPYVSRDGTWLMVERCVREADVMSGHDPYILFPHFMHNDVHDENWGYTYHDDRPVMFDLGHGDSNHLSVIASDYGVPEKVINERIA